MFKRILIFIILVVSLLSLVAQPAYADDTQTQEDPQAAKTIFSSLSLMLYYADSLDLILHKDIESTQNALNKMPFANIPEKLNQPTSDFAASGIELSHSIVELTQIWQQENILIKQFRLGEAKILGDKITEGLPQTYEQLAQLKTAAENTGVYLKVATLSPDNALKQSYDNVMAKIEQLQAMLDLLNRPLLELSPEQLNQLLKTSDNQKLLEALKTLNPEALQEALKTTDLTLEIDPLTAYVGDSADYSGSLTAQGMPLAGRSIDLLLNSAFNLTLVTDSQGLFQGTFQIPYQYNPELEVQAVYYPQGQDVGVYLGSASPVITLNILYYEANLVLGINNPAYPGRQATLTAKFDYGSAPPVERENSELYLDDMLLKHFTAQSDFTRDIPLESTTQLGRHIVTLTVPAKGRYAPAHADCLMDVELATVNLDMDLPGASFMPGHLELKGQAYSELGPLQNADINFEMGKDFRNWSIDQSGAFATRLNLELELSLLGSRAMIITIQPREPWNAPLVITRNIFLINWAGLGIFLEFLALMYVSFLPVRVKKTIRKQQPAAEPRQGDTLPPEIAPMYSTSLLVMPAEIKGEEEVTPGSIFKWYRLVLNLAQKITNSLVKPQQTLREYANANSQKLGPVSKYFFEFTLLVEKLLYSRHKADQKDIETSRNLSETIQKEAKHENL